MRKDFTSMLVNDRSVTIRPIRPTDVVMEADFVRNLSSETKHYRFFGALNELSATEAHRLCDVDGCQSMAFVSTVEEGEREVEIGVCRYAPAAKADVREMAITIADKWQNTNLASALLQRLIGSAKHYDIRELYATELSDNGTMRDFAREFGMSTQRDPGDATQVIYSLSI
jgi:acetyltransferase (GNAT) family protein